MNILWNQKEHLEIEVDGAVWMFNFAGFSRGIKYWMKWLKTRDVFLPGDEKRYPYAYWAHYAEEWNNGT